MVNLLPTLLNLYLKHRCKKELSQDVRKKLMLCQCWKRKIKTYQKKCRPISLMPIFGKISERVLFKDLLNYFQKNQLFTQLPVRIFTRWFLHSSITVAIYCSRYQFFFFWLWSIYCCRRCILIFQRLMRKFGLTGSYSNWKPMALKENS